MKGANTKEVAERIKELEIEHQVRRSHVVIDED